jgi:hypothetical protein
MSFCQKLKEKRGELQEKLRELYETKDRIKEAKTLKEVERIKRITEKVKGEIAEINKLISSFLSEVYKERGKEPFFRVFRRLAKENILSYWSVYAQPDGTLAGVVSFQKKDNEGNIVDRWLPFKGNTLLKEIDDKEIIDTYKIYTLPETSILEGSIQLKNKGWVKFQWGKDGAKIVG